MNAEGICGVTVFIETYCPYCGGQNTEVLDDEPWEYEHRLCHDCGKDYDLLFETYCVNVLSHNGDELWHSESCGD